MNNEKINVLFSMIQKNSLIKPDQEIEIDTELFNLGYLDSFSIINLVQMMEDEFNIVFDYNDMQEKHFCSPKALVRLLESKYNQ